MDRIQIAAALGGQINEVERLRLELMQAILDEDWGAKSLSGAYDTFFTTVTDPLGKLGKAAGLARKAVVTRPLGAQDTNANRLLKDFLMPKSLRSVKVISPQTLARTINEGREEGGELYNTLSWFAKSDRVAIRNHPMVQQSNDADTLAYMLGEAKTVDDVADTLVATARLGTSKEIGSAAARLIAKRRDLAFVLDKINDTTDLDKAKFIGEGEWVKDSAYQVYELDGKYYSVIVIGHSNKEIMDDSITEIQEQDINKYI